ncbi:protein artichoke-like [Schistocerca cancellata]|uniref:protein artichoke-like n=1 Tax=Schistocerca cancellata TaxID=274614 RepID=UPI0021177382|nr:protein artichoke-like [Schistocerca cancellata]XP_049762662.1 protein artichoke-like [Schistocerca cancellata]
MRWLWLLAAAVAAAPSPSPSPSPSPPSELEVQSWRCPAVGGGVACACDLPHTLRCAGGAGALRAVGSALRGLSPPRAVSLLEVSARGLPALDAPPLAGVLLHGLVVSSGALRRVSARAFAGLAGPLQALGLPDNRLDAVPAAALAALPALQRLDLSRNLLQRIDDRALQELPELTFLDVSDNRLTELSADAFSRLPALRTLRLRGNRLHAVSHVRGLAELRELDLSANALAGPLGPRTLPRGLAKLHALDLSHNQLTSVRRGALAGLESLRTLSLEHNHIDVLEDEALGAPQLQQLVLAHNRIVAVSGASLARLGALTHLDLAHNFLRALAADLVAPLSALRELRLDDNDISMVAGAALERAAPLLSRLTLTDNPLNCDCSLSEFASWLRNASESRRLSAADVATAICATPPSLENGALAEVAPDDLVCGEELPPADDEVGDEIADGDGDEAGAGAGAQLQLPDSEATAALRAFRYDAAADAVWLQWSVRGAGAYSCHSLVVYEERGAREVLLENVRLDCNSSQVGDPAALPLRLAGLGLQRGRSYRYCLLLLRGGGARSDELLLEWGCSDAIPLSADGAPARPLPELTALHADVASDGVLTATATLLEVPVAAPCTLTIAVYRGKARERSQHVNCSYPEALFRGLQLDGTGQLRLCASVDAPGPQPEDDTLCVPVRHQQAQSKNGDLPQPVGAGVVAALAAASATVILVALLYVASRVVFGRTHMAAAHQYFLTGQQDDERPPHYVKLQATTKL